MANLFMLDTDQVSSKAEAVNKITTSINEALSSVSAWDVSGEDADKFDFAGTKDLIAKNVGVCMQTVSATAAAMSQVVSSHMELQSTMQFDPQTGKQKETKKSNKEKTNEARSRGLSSGGGSRRSGGSSSSGYSGGSNSGYVNIPAVAPAVAPVVPSIVSPKKEEKKTEEKASETTQIKEVAYAAIKIDIASDEAKEIVDNSKYTNDGYSTLDRRYVIACDESFAKVGDVIRFTKDDKVIECVVGVNTVTADNKSKCFFIVDEKNQNIQPLKFAGDLVNTETKVENIGNYETAPTVSETTNLGIPMTVTGSNSTNQVKVDNSNTVTTTGVSVGAGTVSSTSANTQPSLEEDKKDDVTNDKSEASEESDV